jgi:hypothetical protein
MNTNRPPSDDMGPLGPKGVMALKIAIVVMGIMIIAGIALVIGRMIYMASSPKSTSPLAVERPASATELAPEQAVTLPQGAIVEQTSISGNRLLVRYKAGSTSEILIHDLATGRVLSRIRLDTTGSR